MKHPQNKLQRKVIDKKKHSLDDKKKRKDAEHKLAVSLLKEQEAEEELRNASYRSDDQSSVVGEQSR